MDDTGYEPQYEPEPDERPPMDQRAKIAIIALTALAIGLGVALGVVASDPPTEKIVVTQTETKTTTVKPTTTTVTTSTLETTTTTTTTTDETTTSTVTSPPETSTVTETVTGP
jgi:hypothetical protein